MSYRPHRVPLGFYAFPSKYLTSQTVVFVAEIADLVRHVKIQNENLSAIVSKTTCFPVFTE